ncbi:hypothetical protein OH77DRAFT_1519275 [Trametes cingulata]|nr:hypothetical protein OH77DRAFT_1519275 [Trametes cingulata]
MPHPFDECKYRQPTDRLRGARTSPHSHQPANRLGHAPPWLPFENAAQQCTFPPTSISPPSGSPHALPPRPRNSVQCAVLASPDFSRTIQTEASKMIDLPKESKRESVMTPPPPELPSSSAASPSGPSTSEYPSHAQVETSPASAPANAAPPAYSMLPNGTDQPTYAQDPTSPRTRDQHDQHDDDKSSGHSSRREHSAGRAFTKGMLVIVSAPVFVAGAGLAGMLAVLYGAGKLIEGIGKGLSMGPEAAYRKYQAREERKMERKAAKRAARRKSQSRV